MLVTWAAMDASHDQAAEIATDKAPSSPSWMPRTTPALQGFPRAIPIRVAIDGVDGGFEDKLVNHAATARTIEDDDAESAAIRQVLVFSRSTLPRRKAGAGRGNGGPGGSCGLRKR